MKLIFFAAMSVLFSASAVLAQSEIGGATLNGSVTDPSGAIVPGARVSVIQSSTGLRRTADTSSAGVYVLSSLPAGTYDVILDAKGFKAFKASSVALSVGSIATLDVKLEVGAEQETVTVEAEVGFIEPTRSQTSTDVDSNSVSELPVNGRNFLDFTVLTPGVVRDPTRGGDLSFGGQRGTANSLQVDGSDANNVFFGQSTGRAGTGRNPYSFSQDAIQELRVSTNGYNAEIGRAGGGVINVITKSGTNDLHGTMFEFFRDKGLNANTWANNHANGGKGLPKGVYHFNQFGGNVGGPIVKDKLFFFFDYDGQRNTTPIAVIPGAQPPSDALSQQGFQMIQQYIVSYTQGLNNNVYLVKSDYNMTSDQRLSVRYNANRFTGVNYENGFQTNALGHTGNALVSTDNISGTHTWVLSPASILESRFTFTRDNEPGQANSSAPETVVQQSGSTALTFGRNNFSPRYTNAKTYQWVEGISIVQGRHSLKFGSDLDWQKIGNYFPGFFSGSYTFTSYANFAQGTPSSFTQAFAGDGTNGPTSHPSVSEYAFYAQDAWRVNRKLTLNFGIRYDLFNYAQPTVKNPDAGLAAAGLDTSRIPQDSNNFAPRFGLAYKLTESGNTVVRGGYGMFYGRTPTILTSTAILQNGIQVQTYTINSNFPVFPNLLPGPPQANRTPDIFVFDPHYVQPLTHQWDLNVERLLARNYLITVGYLGVRGEHLTRTRDINWLPALPLAGAFPDGTPVTYLRHPGRANPAFGRISIFDSGADSNYHAGFLQMTKRYSQRFQAQASYTFAKVLDDDPDFTSVVVGTDDAKNAQDTLTPNLERGRGNADIRHRFIFSGIWDLSYAKSLQNRVLRGILSGYQLSTITSLQSGRPFTATAGGDPNGDGNTRTDRPPDVGRNTVEGPGFASIDMRFTREIFLYKERAKLKLIFEAFNLTNRVNFSSITAAKYNFSSTTKIFTPVSTFGVPTATSDPRILQLAAKITF